MTGGTYQTPGTKHQAPSTLSDLIALLKPGVMSLVVFTGFAGMMVAPGYIHPLQMFLAVLTIALGSGAGAAINMWYDRDIDALMTRTAKRPIPAGRIVPDDALSLGLLLSVLAVTLLGLGVNWVASGILAFAIFFYAVVYTMWLKRSTPQNIVIGGAAGAFPPMIGWAAVTGDVSVVSVLLFSIIFLWTPPHFWALALYKNSDYAAAGVPMMPVVAGKPATKRMMIWYTWALVVCTLSLPVWGGAGVIYTVSALLLGGAFLACIYKTSRDETALWPRCTFRFSILYLFVLFFSLMVDHAVFS